MLNRFFRKNGQAEEVCFYVQLDRQMTEEEVARLRWVLGEAFERGNLAAESFLAGKVYEAGPRLNFATAFSTNATSI